MSWQAPWLNGLVFAIAAAAIWAAGTRLERYAGALARRLNLGQAFSGMLLLAGATSLPEVSTTITAVVFLNDPTLAVHNLLGGVALQTGILAVADSAKRRAGALTYFSPDAGLLIQGVGLLLLLQLIVAGAAARGLPQALSVSAWLVALLPVYLGMLYLVYRTRRSPGWTVAGGERGSKEPEAASDPRESEGTAEEASLLRLWVSFAVASAVVLVGGWFAANSADALAEQTGLGSAFLGATLLAAATSLPEVSTTVAASRRGRYTAAVSNIFGSNAFDVTLLLLTEALYRGGSVLENVAPSLIFVATLGGAMTCIYLWGLLERRNRTIAGVGWDSAAAVVAYAAGVAVLYFL